MKALLRSFVFAWQKSFCHLALCAAMLLAFAPLSAAAWQCEGQECGVTAWVCCCAMPDGRHSAHSPLRETAQQSHCNTPNHTEKVGVCAQKCHCSMVMSDNGALPLVGAPTIIGPVLSLAVLPRAVALNVPSSPETAQRLPSRGPPPIRFPLASCSWRGPPLS